MTVYGLNQVPVLAPVEAPKKVERKPDAFSRVTKEVNSYHHNVVTKFFMYVLSIATRVFSGSSLDYANYRARNFSVSITKTFNECAANLDDFRDLILLKDVVRKCTKAAEELEESTLSSPASANLIKQIYSQIKNSEKKLEECIDQLANDDGETRSFKKSERKPLVFTGPAAVLPTPDEAEAQVQKANPEVSEPEVSGFRRILDAMSNVLVI